MSITVIIVVVVVVVIVHSSHCTQRLANTNGNDINNSTASLTDVTPHLCTAVLYLSTSPQRLDRSDGSAAAVLIKVCKNTCYHLAALKKTSKNM